MLVPQGELYDLGGGMTVSAIGLIDERLHIQIAVKDNLQTDNHGSFYLKAKDGAVLHPIVTADFNNVDGRVLPERIDDHDAVFELPQGGLAGYELYADCWQSGMLIEGNWQVTFKLGKD